MAYDETCPVPGDYCEFCPTSDPSRHHSWCPTYDGDEIGCETCGARDCPVFPVEKQQRDLKTWAAVGWPRVELECKGCTEFGVLLRAVFLGN